MIIFFLLDAPASYILIPNFVRIFDRNCSSLTFDTSTESSWCQQSVEIVFLRGPVSYLQEIVLLGQSKQQTPVVASQNVGLWSNAWSLGQVNVLSGLRQAYSTAAAAAGVT